MSSSDSEQNVHWYYRIGGKEAGPAIISRLRQMAREGILTEEDLVRKGMTGEWVSAGTVSEIHARARTVAVDVPTEPEPRTIEVKRSNRLNDLRLSLQYAISGALGTIVDRLGLIRTLAGYVIFGVTLCCLIGTILKWRISDESAHADPLTTYQSLWSELQSNRKNKVAEAVWNEFSERGQKELAPIVAYLEREAGATNRSAQFLLWAGRDCLPKMFVDARTEPSAAEHQLKEYLENVQLLSQGKPIYGGNRGGRRLQSSETFSVTNWLAHDPIGAIITGLLTLTNFAIVIWFVRRKRRGIS
jgi:hypothetical protein